ncbi:MAG: 6-bladed beta-propeller [Acidobacteriota bacterium]|nr:6-bladed beta-propeller [Acidobacteriota bacterium]
MWLLLLFFTGGFLNPAPEIYQPLSKITVVRNDTGTLFVLDVKMKEVHLYGADGKRLKTIGGPGEGPGKFPRVSYIRLDNGMLQVTGLYQTHFFSQDGRFLYHRKHPSDVHSLEKLQKGRLAFKGGPYDSEWELLRFPEDDFKVRETLTRFEVTPASRDKRFNPALDRSILVVNDDGSKAVIKAENQSFFWLYDQPTNRLEMIETGIRGKPFDKDLGDMALRFMNRKRKGRFKADFPERFPPIFDIGFTVTGKIFVLRWYAFNKGPHKQKEIADASLLQFFTTTGERVQPDILDLYPNLVISADEHWVYYVHKLAEDESYTVARVERSKAEHALAEESERQFCYSCLDI